MREGRDDLEDLLGNLDMEDYLSWAGVDYRKSHGRSGLQLQLRECPRCGGDEWKVYLNADSGLGNCFHGSCQGEPGFNKFTFIGHLQNAKGRQLVDHIKDYARELGWQPKREKVEIKAPEPGQDVKLPANIPLPIQGRNLAYLDQRGITIDTAVHFGLSFAQDGWYNYEVNGERKGQRYVKRILIPVHDIHGNLVNFQGRDVTGEQEPRYLFPPGLPGTAFFVYNAHRAMGAKRVVVGEGAFDAWACHQVIHDAVAVATFGKHLSYGDHPVTQLAAFRVLRDAGLDEVTFMWDGSKGAALAACEAGDLLRGIGLKVRIAFLPKDKDPNEATPAQVRQAYEEAVPYSGKNGLSTRAKILRLYGK